MKKLLWVLSLLFFTTAMIAQSRTITGKVSDSTGESLIGANVLAKGTTVGTVTDFDGNYRINVPETATTLVFSYTGFATQEVALGASNVIDVTLSEGEILDEVVVTALGISREKKSLGYSTQTVDADAVTQSKTDNFVNNLSGKVAGVEIKTNNNFGGSTNVVIRGNSSLTGNNQALFVIDGIPVNNSNRNTNAQKGGSAGYDYGSAISDVNPNDIESINVLKGAAATALYGSRAANGAVIITTKKGAKNKGLGITLNSGVTVGQIDKSTFVSYQDKYGAGYGPYYSGPGSHFEEVDVDGDGELDLVAPTYDDASYGAAFDPSLNVYQWESFIPESEHYGKPYPYVAGASTPVDFFETAVSFTNSVAFTGGGEKSSFRLGYTNYNATGVLPNSELEKHTFNFNSSYQLSDQLTASFNGSYIRHSALGRNSTGYSDNLMSQFRQWWQVNVDMNRLQELYDETGRNVTWNSAAPWAGNYAPQYWDNPYWTRYRNYQTDQRDRFIGGLALTYAMNDWLSATGRVSVDSYNDLREERRAVGSVATPFGVNRDDEKSGYQRYELGFSETNIDFMLTGDRYLTEDLSLKVLVGTNLRYTRDSRLLNSTSGGLVVPELYSLSNSVNSLPTPYSAYLPENVFGYFGNASLGYKNYLYLDGTWRTDVSSTLPEDNRVYNYYSGSAGLIFSELIDSDFIDFGKLRLSYAGVGNSAGALRVNDTYVKSDNFGSSTIFSVPSTKNNVDLKAEFSKSLEAGIEMNMLDNRLGLDLAVYKTNTEDQIMPVSVSRATGYSFKYVNAGEIENKGVEVALRATPVKTQNFTWQTNLNWARNVNEVISLFDGVDNLQLESYQGGISINATVGQAYGTIRGTGFKYHENGQKIVNESGYYVAEADQVIGNVNPDWRAGWSNVLSYKNVSLNFLIDMQQGGDVYSLDMHYGQGTGIIDYTAGLNELGNPVRNPVTDGADSGGILNEGVQADGTPNTVRARADYFGGAYYWGNASRNPGALTVYDASFIKLREAGITYNFPKGLFKGSVKGAALSLVGTNLWIIKKHVPFADPESGLSSGNAQGYISGAYPTTRTFGFNLKLDF